MDTQADYSPALGNEGGIEMKKLLVPLAAVVLLSLAVPAAFSEAELGLGLTPGIVGGGDPNADPIINFHVGYSWTILYASWDAYAMPDYWVYNATSINNPQGGYLVPGFLNLFDIGVKIVFKPFIGYAEIGTNSLYLRGGANYGKWGVNFRLGGGLKFGFWGINLSGTQIFTSGGDLNAAIHYAWHGDWSYLVDGMTPTLNFVIYF
jgi:hypothetical protein